jgi:DNA helicase IV
MIMESDEIFSAVMEQGHLDLTISTIDGFAKDFPKRVDNVDTAAQRNALEKQLARYQEVREEPFHGVIFERNAESGEETYGRVGRTAIHDNQSNVIVFSWTTDEGRKLIQAERSIDENLASATVEIANGKVVRVIASGASRVLGRRRRIKENRKGELTDIIELIHPDQDDIVRIEYEGPLVIEGGPGTGKTVVALQRIAYKLLDNSVGLFDSDEVLVVGPTNAYTEYVRRFLPGLGIGRVRYSDFNSVSLLRLTMEESSAVENFVEESDALVRTKNSANMIRLIQGSVWPEVESFGIEVTVNKNMGQKESRFIDSDEIEQELNAIRRRFQDGSISYKQAQEILRLRLHSLLITELRTEKGKSARTVESRRDELFDLWLSKIGQYSQQERQKWRRTLDSPASGRLKRAMSGIMSDYYQRDIEIAIDLVSSTLEIDIAGLRDALDELGAEKKKPGGLRTYSLDDREESNIETLEDISNEEYERVRLGGTIPKIVQLANQLLPNKSALNTARSICSGDKKLYERILGKNGVSLAERLNEAARARGDKGRYVWTNADLPILSEVKFLLEGNEGVDRFSHVVIDEAQDLTRLQARVISRCIRNSQVSLVGDLNQATRIGSLASWNAISDELDLEDFRVESLRHNYRVPQNIYDYARLYLSEDDRVETPTCDIDGGTVEVLQSPLADTTSTVQDKVRNLTADGARVVIISDDIRIREAVNNLGLSNTVVLAPEESKGLEVDHAIVVSPNRWFNDSVRLNRLMYVVLTRATKSVTIIQHEPDRFGILLPNYDSVDL